MEKKPYYQILDLAQEIMEGDESNREFPVLEYLEKTRPSFLSSLILNGGLQETPPLQAFLIGLQSGLDHIRGGGVPEDLDQITNDFPVPEDSGDEENNEAAEDSDKGLPSI